MNKTLQCLRARKIEKGEEGFTLIELLIAIAQQMIRGTLSSVYVGRRRLVLASVIRDLFNTKVGKK